MRAPMTCRTTSRTCTASNAIICLWLRLRSSCLTGSSQARAEAIRAVQLPGQSATADRRQPDAVFARSRDEKSTSCMQDPRPTRFENVDAVAGAVTRGGGNGGGRKVEVSPDKLLDAEVLGFFWS